MTDPEHSEWSSCRLFFQEKDGLCHLAANCGFHKRDTGRNAMSSKKTDGCCPLPEPECFPTLREPVSEASPEAGFLSIRCHAFQNAAKLGLFPLAIKAHPLYHDGM